MLKTAQTLPPSPPKEPLPKKGQVFIKFKKRKSQRGFMVTEQQAHELITLLAFNPPPSYVTFETAFGGLEFVRLDRFNSIEFITGVENGPPSD